MIEIPQSKKNLIASSCAVFSSKQGKELLKLLKEQYLMASVRDPNKSDAHACVREGENNLIRFFMQSIELQSMIAQSAAKEKSK